MMKFSILSKQTSGLISVFLIAAGSLMADVVETKNGSKFTGKVVLIDDANVVLNTDFAGDIKIKKDQIAALTTDTPLNVRLSNGTVAEGTVASAGVGAPAGSIVVNSPQGAITTDMSNIAITWAPGAKDPDLVKLERHWSFEAGMDVAGKTGNSEQIGTNFSFRATLKSNHDQLQLYANYDRQVTDKEKSADQLRIGADYQNNFAGRFSWYARDELGFDRVKDIDFYNTAAAGIGYDAIKTKIDTLTLRAGLSHRYEKYGTPGQDNLSEVGLDLGLVNQLTMKTWSMVNRITYTPAFSDFGLYRIYHESYVELPMASPLWKFRVGVSNDYNSSPTPGLERLDTTYFARLLLTWK